MVSHGKRERILREARANIERLPEIDADLERRRVKMLFSPTENRSEPKPPEPELEYQMVYKAHQRAQQQAESDAAWNAWCDSRIAAAIAEERRFLRAVVGEIL